jgi:hypothetical protein
MITTTMKSIYHFLVDRPMINPMPKCKMWAMRQCYALLLQLPLIIMMRYYPPSTTLDYLHLTVGNSIALIFLTVNSWWCMTFIATFWYLEKYVEFWSDQQKKKRI